MNPPDQPKIAEEWFAEDEWSSLQEAWQSRQPEIAVDDHALLGKIKRRVRFNKIWNNLVIGNNLFWLLTFAYLAYYMMTNAPLVLALPYAVFLGPMMAYVTVADYRLRRQAGDIDHQQTRSYLDAAIQHCRVAIKLRRTLNWVYLYCVLFIIGYSWFYQTVENGRYANDGVTWIFTALVAFYVAWMFVSWRWQKHKQNELAKYENILAQYETDGALPELP
ncbi:hypothetical protein [Acanthopleuribacter pedis]|uniref:Uncharacterized protein n=1 Tax=Acanthopleuribacter pedis TaxID=442870 RepID=A0A8J7Q7H3_9BACT|nr:hypothetical protein [Acanthopleuribacter pedis]MBO1318229.1 hypothetical protein [Acanthopleuribacter pedis]